MCPLSHAILKKRLSAKRLYRIALRRRGLREVDRHRRKMEAAGIGNYPLRMRKRFIWIEISKKKVCGLTSEHTMTA